MQQMGKAFGAGAGAEVLPTEAFVGQSLEEMGVSQAEVGARGVATCWKPTVRVSRERSRTVPWRVYRPPGTGFLRPVRSGAGVDGGNAGTL